MIHMADPAGYPEKPDVAVTNNSPINITLTWGDDDAGNITPTA
jgi:hypothetical protein